jgi:hypothetical protein
MSENDAQMRARAGAKRLDVRVHGAVGRVDELSTPVTQVGVDQQEVLLAGGRLQPARAAAGQGDRDPRRRR